MGTNTKALIREGWEILIKKFGLQKATELAMRLERGKGDSVKEIAEYWGDATIEEIHNRVIDWTAKAESINKRGER
jgi:hypothetical protein